MNLLGFCEMKETFDLKNLTDKYSDMIYHIALRYLSTKDDAEDIVQEVFTIYIAEIKSGKSFDTEEYEISEEVKSYSQKISADTGR